MPFYDAAQLQTLRELHPIAQISERLGLAVASGRRAFCPKCQPDGGSTPDLAFYRDTLHCFKCAWHPDVFELVQNLLNVNFSEAVGWLLEASGTGASLGSRASVGSAASRALVSSAGSQARHLAAVPTSSSPETRPLRNFASLFKTAQALAYRHEDEVDAYLRSRGFTFEQTKRFVGYLPEDRWIGRPGASGRIVFPHYAYADATLIPNLYGRALLDDPKDLRHDHGRGTRGFWSNDPRRARTSSHLVVTEGVFDALGLMAMGSAMPVVAIFGAQGFRLEKFPMLRNLTIGFDQGLTGREKAKELQEKAHSLGITVQLVPEDVYDGEKDLGAAWKSLSSCR